MREIALTPGGDPFYLPGGEVGCVTVHGFTSSPQEMRWLGEHLNQQGYTVFGPRLTGHGRTARAMRGVRWPHWVADVLSGITLLRQQCQQVYLVGLSMGGALVLTAGARAEVDGIVAMAAPHRIHSRLVPLLPLLAWTRTALEKHRDTPEDIAFNNRVKAEQAARGEPPIGHISYPVYPLSAALQLDELLKAMDDCLPYVTAPTLLIYSEQDRMIPLEDMEDIYDEIGTSRKTKHVLHQSGHVLTEDMERETVYDLVASFIAEQVAGAT